MLLAAMKMLFHVPFCEDYTMSEYHISDGCRTTLVTAKIYVVHISDVENPVTNNPSSVMRGVTDKVTSDTFCQQPITGY
jgi:hypothetical protein